jgi:hypothetical protein
MTKSFSVQYVKVYIYISLWFMKNKFSEKFDFTQLYFIIIQHLTFTYMMNRIHTSLIYVSMFIKPMQILV